MYRLHNSRQDRSSIEGSTTRTRLRPNQNLKQPDQTRSKREWITRTVNEEPVTRPSFLHEKSRS